MRRVTLAAAISLGLLGLGPTNAAQSATPSASVAAPAQRLVDGCSSTYYYTYAVDPGDNDWLLQITIKDASGTSQAFQFFTSGDPGDPTSGTSHFQLCSKNVHAPGRFTISAELDLNDGTNQTATFLPDYYFQITPAVKTTTKKVGKCSKPKYAKHHKKKCRKAKKTKKS
ncbi:MAG: hypothetical protein QM572_08695 [Nocardioides sp.]|uniref:hypothetical protein n=1 Tax=Nocardioides sp. TaxID=35761 RepID=UPI0039E47602